MASGARGRVERNEEPDQDTDEAAARAPRALPPALEQHRQRALTAALDGARFRLTRLVRGVAERLTTRPGSVSLATVEGEVRELLLALGRGLLTELVRLRGTGDRGARYVCPCGVHLVRKEVTPLQQRTRGIPTGYFGTITLERTVYAGAGFAKRGTRVS